MNKKGIAGFLANPILWWVIGGIIALIFLVGVVGGRGITTPGIGTTKNIVQCDVHIHNPIIGGPRITSYNCDKLEPCRGGWFAITAGLSILKDEGVVKLKMADSALDKEKYAVWRLGGDEDITLKVCTSSSTGTITLTDEAGKTIEEKDITI